MFAPTDGSPEMAAVASRHLGRTVETLLFHDLDAVEAYDGVWANACLLHVPRPELADILARIWRALKPAGISTPATRKAMATAATRSIAITIIRRRTGCARPMPRPANGVRCRSRAAKSEGSTTRWRRCCSSWRKKAAEERLPSPRYCPDIAAVRRVREIPGGCGWQATALRYESSKDICECQHRVCWKVLGMPDWECRK